MRLHCPCLRPAKEPSVAQRGFTLIEMLVTLVLMALLSVLGWRALDATERSSGALQEHTSDTLVVVRTLDQLESDLLSHAYYEAGIPDSSGRSGVELATTLPAALQWQHPQLSVLRVNPAQGLERIVWVQQEQTLVRQAQSVGPAGQAAAVLDVQPTLRSVSGFELQVWIPGKGWVLPQQAPAGLRASGLQIQIHRMHQGVMETYRKVVVLP